MAWNTVSAIVKKPSRVTASVSVLQSGLVKINVGFSDEIYRAMGNPKVMQVQYGDGEHAGMMRLEFAQVAPPDSQDWHEVTENVMSAGGARARIPGFPTLPETEVGKAPCEFIDQYPTSDMLRDNAIFGGNPWLVVKLPLDAWQREIDSRKPKHAVVDQQRKPDPKPAQQPAAAAPLRKIYNDLPKTNDQRVGGNIKEAARAAHQLDAGPREDGEGMPLKDGSNYAIDAVAYLRKQGFDVARLSDGSFILEKRQVAMNEIVTQINACRKLKDLPAVPVSRVA